MQRALAHRLEREPVAEGGELAVVVDRHAEHGALSAGDRCISYDRRGFGRSSQPTTGYDYDTFAGDLKALLDRLARDQDVVLAGFSMGPAKRRDTSIRMGSAGVSKAALLGAIPVPAADR